MLRTFRTRQSGRRAGSPLGIIEMKQKYIEPKSALAYSHFQEIAESTWGEGHSMKTDLGIITAERKKRDAINEGYIRTYLACELSVAIDDCFSKAEDWSCNRETLRNYRRYIDELCNKYGVLCPNKPVQLLRGEQSSFVVEQLLAVQSLSDTQKKLRMHALIFVFQSLEKETSGFIRALKMPKELKSIGPAKNDSKQAASCGEVAEIHAAAERISERDALVLKLIFYMEKPLQFVLSLECDLLDSKDRLIQVVNDGVMQQLRDYVRATANVRGECSRVFVTNQGRPLHRTTVQKTLEKANAETQLPYRITTKMLQRCKQFEKLNSETRGT